MGEDDIMNVMRTFNTRHGQTTDYHSISPRLGEAPHDGVAQGISVAPKFEGMLDDYSERNGWDRIRPLNGRNATAEEQAEPLVLLNSNMARFISGVAFCVDFGHIAAVEVGQLADIWGLYGTGSEAVTKQWQPSEGR
jgi:hypothetical protein